MSYMSPSTQEIYEAQINDQLGQDPLANFDEEFPELRNNPAPEKKKKTKIIKKKEPVMNISFLRNKILSRAHRIIKIQILDGNNSKAGGGKKCDSDSDNTLVSAQYVCCDPIDEILDQTENIIKKISKSLSDNIYD